MASVASATETTARNLRQKQRISYYEPEEPSFDEYMYCDECSDFVYEYCAIHGPLLIVPDDKVPLQSPYPPIVPRAALTIPSVFLHLARSNIPGAGIGVFSTLTLPRGVRFGPYRGLRAQTADSAYCWQIYDRNNKPSHVVDAADAARSNWMRYVNCARGWHEQNLVAYQYQGHLYYRTVKIIRKFEELLVFYGGEFARSLRVDLRAYNAPPLYAPRIGPPKKKPRFEPPSKKPEEVTPKTSLESHEPIRKVPSEETSAGKPAVEDPKVNEKTQPKKRKAKSDEAKTAKNTKAKGAIAKDTLNITKVKKIKAKPQNNVNNIAAKKTQTQITSEAKITKVEKIQAKPKNNDSKKTANKTQITSEAKTNIQKVTETISTPQVNEKTETETKDQNNNSTLICNDCSKPFDTKTKLIQHLISHKSTKDIYFNCKQCPYSTVTKQSLESHMRLHDIERKHVCKSCGYRFTTKDNLNEHVNVKHDSNTTKKHTCDICDYKTNHLGDIKKHLNIHAGLKPYTCELCSSKFSQSGNLKTHMTIHTGEKPYSCDVCTYKCNRMSYMKTHLRTHTGEKPFSCDVCTYKCSRMSNFKRHMKTHTGERPYAQSSAALCM